MYNNNKRSTYYGYKSKDWMLPLKSVWMFTTLFTTCFWSLLDLGGHLKIRNFDFSVLAWTAMDKDVKLVIAASRQ